MTAIAHVNAIGTATPPHEVHSAFVQFVRHLLSGDAKLSRLFERMQGRSGIARRWSYIEPVLLPDGRVTDSDDFYALGEWPTTARRMQSYARLAPQLALDAVYALDPAIAGAGITHLIVASCTGFVAPGIDQIVIDRAGLDPGIERTLVGFMGCYAAVNALRLAHHIVRSTPSARVLVVTVELCTLHFQRTADLERLLAMLLFGDGAAAALVTAEPGGLALADFRARTIGGSADAIRWDIGDSGFDMHLGGEVPHRIAEALRAEVAEGPPDGILRGRSVADFDLWAVHAGGRTVLDAVEAGLGLSSDALARSRAVLHDCGNMSSSTLMFILARMLAEPVPGGRDRHGVGLAFGPGLAAESFRFTQRA